MYFSTYHKLQVLPRGVRNYFSSFFQFYPLLQNAIMFKNYLKFVNNFVSSHLFLQNCNQVLVYSSNFTTFLHLPSFCSSSKSTTVYFVFEGGSFKRSKTEDNYLIVQWQFKRAFDENIDNKDYFFQFFF